MHPGKREHRGFKMNVFTTWTLATPVPSWRAYSQVFHGGHERNRYFLLPSHTPSQLQALIIKFSCPISYTVRQLAAGRPPGQHRGRGSLCL